MPYDLIFGQHERKHKGLLHDVILLLFGLGIFCGSHRRGD